MAEKQKLLLRKGSLANLSTLPKQAGAISITTDVPGIYYDVSATERIRIGDFIPVDNLSALADKARTGLSETALYYAEDENVLAKYDSKQGKLVWINDTSKLTQEDTKLHNLINGIYGATISEDTVIEHTILGNAGKIAELEEAIGNVDGNVIESISVKIGEGGSELVKGPDAQKKITITLPKGLSNYDSGSEISTINDGITTNTKLIKQVYGNGGNIPTTGNATVHQNAQNIETIKGAEWNNETIKGNATAISNLKGNVTNYDSATVTGNAKDIADLKGTVTGYNSATVTGNAKEIADIKTSLDDITKTNGTIDTKVAALKGDNQDTINDITVYGNNNAITALKGNISTANTVLGNAQAISDLKGNVSDYSSATVTGNAKEIADLRGNSNTANTVLGNAKEIGDIKTQLDTITGVGTGTTYSTIAAGVSAANAYTDSAIEQLSDSLNGTIASANSMTFRGTVNSVAANWWTGVVKAGDTYVIGSNDIRIDISGDGVIDLNDEPCRIGDLLVASHDATGDTYPQIVREAGHNFTSTSPGWYLIRTGYDKNLENRLQVANNEITLQSYAGTDLGSVSFVAPKVVNIDDAQKAGSNIEITTSETDIQFNLVWVDF